MRATAVRRTALAATTLTLAALVTACGGAEEEKGGTEGKAKAPATASALPEAKALSAEELSHLLVEEGDLKGTGYRTQGDVDLDLLTATAISTDNPACKPIADAMSAAPSGATVTWRRMVVTEAKGGTATAVALGSYDGRGAQEWFGSLKAAGAACGNGFTATEATEKTRVSKVVPESLAAGDEALAWSITADVKGAPVVTRLAVVRKDNVMAVFPTVGLVGDVKKQPKPLIDAQAAKLG
ncbi:hypothetical protein [Streptomyces sp. NPDC012508]|uniref:hypothetical protein n=1 Tax=Streptomyces sp. NPDC012508 TaxID=3364837 RepID=UPI00369748C9